MGPEMGPGVLQGTLGALACCSTPVTNPVSRVGWRHSPLGLAQVQVLIGPRWPKAASVDSDKLRFAP